MRNSLIAILLAATALSPALAGPKGKDQGGGKPAHAQQKKAHDGGGHAAKPDKAARSHARDARPVRQAAKERSPARERIAVRRAEAPRSARVERVKVKPAKPARAERFEREDRPVFVRADRPDKRMRKAEKRWREARDIRPDRRETYRVVERVVRYAPAPRYAYVDRDDRYAPRDYYVRRTVTYAPLYYSPVAWYDRGYDWYDYGYADPYYGYDGYSPWDYRPAGFGDGLFGGDGGGLIAILLPVLLQGVLGGELGGGFGDLGGLGGLLGSGYAGAPLYDSPLSYASYAEPFAASYDYGYADPYGYDPYGYPYEPMDPYAYGDPLGGDLLSGSNLAGLVLPALLSGGEPALFI